MAYNLDKFDIAHLERFKAKIVIDAAYDEMVRRNSRARLMLIMPTQWWRDEQKICGFFGFDDAEIDYAEQSFENYLGTKNGFDCYVRPKYENHV